MLSSSIDTSSISSPHLLGPSQVSPVECAPRARLPPHVKSPPTILSSNRPVVHLPPRLSTTPHAILAALRHLHRAQRNIYQPLHQPLAPELQYERRSTQAQAHAHVAVAQCGVRLGGCGGAARAADGRGARGRARAARVHGGVRGALRALRRARGGGARAHAQHAGAARAHARAHARDGAEGDRGARYLVAAKVRAGFAKGGVRRGGHARLYLAVVDDGDRLRVWVLLGVGEAGHAP
ncbi:hypothetical protein BD413DRAFT_151666 [Trametes elegans]|nr:hypothetical protein BD413DRAFT_151666 [Trametes elegans]